MEEKFLFGKYSIPLTEQFKSELPPKSAIQIATKLDAEEHPFDYKQCEDTYCKVGLVKAAVDKHVDFIISPGFYVTSIDKNAETLVNQLIQDTNLEQHLRALIQEALIKGSGFMEVAKTHNTT